jgi:hypothetical protein
VGFVVGTPLQSRIDIREDTGKTRCMPTPRYTFRLPALQRRRLEETAAIYGAPMPDFLRGLIGTIVNGESIESRQFRERLQSKLLAQAAREGQMPLPLPKVGRKRRARGKGAGTR